MSIETIYKCDHCGTRCSGDERATIAEWKEPTTITFGKAVHGCSKEHLGIALAKMFGIGVNGEADELLNRKQRELTKLTDANNFLVTERDNMRARLAELEKRLSEATAPPTIDGKTPRQVTRHAYGLRVQDAVDDDTVWEFVGTAVLRAFGNAPTGQTTQPSTVEALRRVRDRIDEDGRCIFEGERYGIDAIGCAVAMVDAEIARLETKPVPKSDHVHELKSCSFCDKSPPDTSTESGLPDAVLAAITLPTKPTKPLRERLEDLATYWYMGDKDDKELNGAYRLARQECAKELREVINDPR